MLKNLSEESKKRYDKMTHHEDCREKQPNIYSSINIQKLSEELEYALHICNKISKIPFFHMYFQLIYKNNQLSFVSSSASNKTNKYIPLEYMKKIEMDDSNKYVLINTNMKLTKSLCLYSYNKYFSILYFRKKREICTKMFNIIFFILDALHILHRHGLFLLYFSKDNLCFNQIEILFIQNFKYCVEKVDESTTNRSINIDYLCNDNEIIHAPLELWVIHYLKSQDIQSLSSQHIETICKNYIHNHIILKTIPLNEKEDHYHKSIQYLQPLINIPIVDNIKFMLKYMDTWDNYGFHIFLLNQIIFKDIILVQLKTNYEADIFWNGIISLCLENILCNPDKRHNIKQTKNRIMEYLNENTKYLRI
jgi:hypothetical protein